jgi:hypothetical protein
MLNIKSNGIISSVMGTGGYGIISHIRVKSQFKIVAKRIMFN